MAQSEMPNENISHKAHTHITNVTLCTCLPKKKQQKRGPN